MQEKKKKEQERKNKVSVLELGMSFLEVTGKKKLKVYHNNTFQAWNLLVGKIIE